MPKAAGSKMPPPVQGSSRPMPASRAILRQSPPSDGPHHVPVSHPPIRGSNDVAAEAVRRASDHGAAIDPRMQHN